MPPERQRFAVVCALLLWCTALIAYRVHIEFDSLASWLAANLCLAFVPILFSSAFQAASARNRWVLAAASFALWLLFLPNAPYILTDLLHLRPRPNVPLWYDLAMLLSCALTGTLFGYISLIDVQREIERKLGRTAGWVTAVGSLMLCGFGIYLGRFVRSNSWYLFTKPLQLGKDIIGAFIAPGTRPHPVPVTLVFGGCLIIGYLALRVAGAPNSRKLPS